ncbi:MAG: hypothetical protein KGJ55_06860 [Gammaproteobacteria bacterium]|nr:hypothetical protein [Gammaproteobacteria bacterium]
MLNTKLAGLILAGSFAASIAFAQPAPAPAQSAAAQAAASQAAAASAVPALNCKPPTPLSDAPSETEVKQFNAGAKAYQTCVQDYVDARRNDLNKYEALAKANAAAANDAITGFNAYVNQLKAKSKDAGKDSGQ